MAIYPSNTTIPKSGNYIWNWLGSSLKKFGAALSPYIDIPQPSPVYRAQVYTFNPFMSIQTNVNINTVGSISWTYLAAGQYSVSFPAGFLNQNTYVSLTQQASLAPSSKPGVFLVKNVSYFTNTILIVHYDDSNIITDPDPNVSLYIEVI